MAGGSKSLKGGGGSGGSGAGKAKLSARELEAKRRAGKNKIDGAKPTETDTYRDTPRRAVAAIRRSARKQSGAASGRRLTRNSED